MTNQTLENIATYMDDEIRESIHGDDLTNDEFLAKYLILDPDFKDLLASEFNI